MAVTARDVAKKAGVSPAAASLVFRGKPGVGDETRERVLAVAREMGFEYSAPSEVRRTSTLQLIIYKKHGKVVSETPFFEQLTKGVSDETYRLGYHRLSISYFYAAEHPSEQLKSLRSTKCAGIVLLATEMRATDVAQFERLGVPVVLLDGWFPSKRNDSVVIDNQRGAWQATQYLISQGHRDVGYLNSNVDIRNFLERRDGYLSAMASLGRKDFDPAKAIVRVGTTIESAFDDMSAYLATGPDLPTAFFADNDIIAAGCMRALAKAGIRVPEDVSIVGFDDMPICQLVYPSLTTMAVPKASMGALAVQRLVALIKGETTGESVRICVLPELVSRESVIKLPANA